MNQLTAKVLEMQKLNKDDFKKEILFTDVYKSIQPTIETVVNSYARGLKGDVHAGYSEATIHLMKCCDVFEYEGFEFLTFYKKTLRNKMIDLLRKLNTDKVKHNTSYEVSLSAYAHERRSGMGSPTMFGTVMDIIKDDALEVKDSYTFDKTLSVSDVLDKFHKVKPVDAEVIEILIQYSAEGFQKKDLTNALANYYGSDKYTGAIQRRVSRCRESFKKFAMEEGLV